MHRLSRAIVLVAALAGAGLATAASEALKPITTNEAAVAVKVTPRVLAGPVWEFEVAFDTHSQDLQDDLAKTATLLAADGRPVAPLEWKGAPPGGHHRAGVLRFRPLQPMPAHIVLSISRPGEPGPRVYTWAAPAR